MNTSNENIDPRSLTNSPNIPINLPHYWSSKHKFHKVPLANTRLKESFLQNITTDHHDALKAEVEKQLPTPPSSQSMADGHNKPTEKTRLPISPPPEEEIRLKELTTHALTLKMPHSRLSVRSRPGAFMALSPQSFGDFQQQQDQPANKETSKTSKDCDHHTSPAFYPNPRKRTRSVIPPLPSHQDSVPLPTDLCSYAQPNVDTQSPNPKARKHLKRHATGVYTGSGFKTHHKRGTSVESLDDGCTVTADRRSLGRKKRNDHGIKDYTPRREFTSTFARQGSPTQRKSRSSRSTTPDVRYEPPTEQFTPPRDVVLHMPSSVVASRSRHPKSSSSIKHSIDRKLMKTKSERLTSPFPLPPLDLSKPVPPPSPTDDPLLLVGPRTKVRHGTIPNVVSSKKLVDASVGVDGDVTQDGPSAPALHSPTMSGNVDYSVWTFGPDLLDKTSLMNVAFEEPSYFDATFDADNLDTCGDVDPAYHGPQSAPAVVFDPNQSTGSNIFYSDDEDAAESGEDEGEFTGRYKFYSIPVKHDPPSSATQARRESWGRPVSPFPFARRANEETLLDEAKRNEHEHLDEDSPPQSPSMGRSKSRFPAAGPDLPLSTLEAQAEVMCPGALTLSEMEERLERKLVQGNVTRSGPSMQHADKEDLRTYTQNWEALQVDQIDNEVDFWSVEQDVASLDDREHAPNVQHRVCGTGANEIGPSPETPGDANQQAYCPANYTGQPEPVAGEEAQKENQENVPNVTTYPIYSPSSRPESPSHPISPACPAVPLSPFKASQVTDHSVFGRLEKTPAAYYDDSFSDEGEPPSGLVEVSSDDPKAAARAAAILKLHHSYIVDGLMAQRARRRSNHGFFRGSSFSPRDGNMDGGDNVEFIRHTRRRRITALAGVTQHRLCPTAPSPQVQSAFIVPGSPPSPFVSAQDALKEAERDVRAASASPGRQRTAQSTSLSTKSLEQWDLASPSLSVNDQSGTKEPSPRPDSVKTWTKAHWRTLDMCFTDERLSVGNEMGLENKMAAVDDIEFGSVVKRFLTQADDDDDWDQDMLLRRVTALSVRQRAGKGAPPSPSQIVSKKPTLAPVVPALPAESRPLSSIPTKLPPSLFAPRYAHLHEEVTPGTSTLPHLSTLIPRSSISKTDTTESQIQAVDPREGSQQRTLQSLGPAPQSQTSDNGLPAPASATRRILSYLNSFVSGGGTNASSKPPLKLNMIPLPLPPPEMRQVGRGPISTPVKKPIPKSQPPRELVHLAETRLPTKPSQFPKAKSAKDMVNLNHVEPPRSVQRPRTVSGPILFPGRTRKDSSGSVKDLVKSFEAVQKNAEEEIKRSNSRAAVRKVASFGDLKPRPIWKP